MRQRRRPDSAAWASRAEERRRCSFAWALLRAQGYRVAVVVLGDGGQVLAEGLVESNRIEEDEGRVFVIGGQRVTLGEMTRLRRLESE